MSIAKFGQTDFEKKAEDTQKSREIVAEILNFGVSQQQILRIAYLLSLELENIDAMKNISQCIKTYIEGLEEPIKSVIET
jgi:hypothetical protein